MQLWKDLPLTVEFGLGTERRFAFQKATSSKPDSLASGPHFRSSASEYVPAMPARG
jgi:hypothetical protein